MVTGASAERIAAVHPRLYHMAHVDSWPSIVQHGLLSTRALLDLYEFEGQNRVQLESQHRPESVVIKHKTFGSAVLRDQKPMTDQRLEACLEGGLTPSDWYAILNSRVFFWSSENRLHRMARAKAYRNDRHIFLVLDTASLLSVHEENVLLSHMNSGCTFPRAFPRGTETFLPLDRYPFEERKKRTGEAFAELLVDYGVPDIMDHIVEVYLGRETERFETIYSA